MTDKDLLRTLMFKNEWTQAELAERLGFDRSQVSRIIREERNLRPATRKLAEKLLKETED